MMRVLVVCSFNKGRVSPFIEDQVHSLRTMGVVFDYFEVIGKGIWGYLGNLNNLKRKIRKFKPDIVHAHYGLSGLLANLQRTVPVVTTFHGSDINYHQALKYSKIAYYLSKSSIFVSKDMLSKVSNKRMAFVIPCGVDVDVFKPFHDICFHNSRFNSVVYPNEFNVLFSSSFSNWVKNYDLARMVCDKAQMKLNRFINLIELKNYSREEVSILMNLSDALLLTSFTEGSPQFIKEGMACNKPIVSTDVGDVKWLFGNKEGCYISSFDPNVLAEKLVEALEFSVTYKNTNGRDRILELGLDSKTIASRIHSIYMDVLNKY